MNEKIETTFGGTRDEITMLAHVFTHYLHAKEKHPYFCDHMIHPALTKEMINSNLDFIRNHLRIQVEQKDVYWDTILECEICEIIDAIANENTPAAVEECYDAIAVLLRVIDVLEGRQKLGRAKEVKG